VGAVIGNVRGVDGGGVNRGVVAGATDERVVAGTAVERVTTVRLSIRNVSTLIISRSTISLSPFQPTC
jgi:hypothetical protein